MAVHRETPKCLICEEPIVNAVYLDQSHIPINQRIIGDTFQRWEYHANHKCIK